MSSTMRSTSARSAPAGNIGRTNLRTAGAKSARNGSTKDWISSGVRGMPSRV